MKQWWLGLSLREKQTLMLGGIAVAIYIVYALIWSPLDNKIVAMREQIQQDQKLLAWMQAADKRLTGSDNPTPTPLLASSLLSVAQKQIKQSALADQLSQLRQAENDAVQLSFKQVDFDKLVTWLADSSRQKGLTVAQLTVAPSESPGIVSAELQLKSS